MERTVLDKRVLIANFPDANEQLPLHRASSPGHCECVEILIRDGYSLLNEKDFNGNAALHLAVLTYNQEHATKIARNILEARANADLADAQQRTALHLVAAEGRTQVAAVLLQHAADVAAKEALRGRTALHVASRAG